MPRKPEYLLILREQTFAIIAAVVIPVLFGLVPTDPAPGKEVVGRVARKPVSDCS